MSLKQSLEENKDHILNSLPTQELKDAFLADLEKAEDVVTTTIEEQVKNAQEPEHILEGMYDGIKKEIESTVHSIKMTAEEEKAAIAEALKNPPVSEASDDEE